MRNIHKFWIVFSVIILFAVGTVTGILLEKYIYEKKAKKRIKHTHTLEKMAKDLSLTETQMEKIRNIFKKKDTRIKAFGREIREKLATMRTQLKEEIKAVLDEKQGKKFDSLIEKHVAKMKKEREKRRKNHKKIRKEKGEIQ